MNLRRLPLKAVLNFRDLGGYPVGDKKATKWRCIFRADGLFCLDKADKEEIISYCNPGLVIDLRGTREQELRPNSFKGMGNIRFENIPLITETRDIEQIRREWSRLDTGYTAVIQYAKEEIKQIFESIAESLPKPVLYNCTAGKDRTGIVSCLILGACGVDSFDIVGDYEVSSTYIRKNLEKVTEPGQKLEMEFVVSPAEVMMNLIKYIDDNYGSIINYLKECGIKDETLDKIRLHFLVNAK